MSKQQAKKVLKIITEKGGSMRRAIKEAGYSQAYADTPKKLEKTKTWQELLDKYLPKDLVLETHQGLLKAERSFCIGDTEIATAPDWQARAKGVDMANKIFGTYAAERVDLTTRQYGELSDEELADKINRNRKVVEKDE